MRSKITRWRFVGSSKNSSIRSRMILRIGRVACPLLCIRPWREALASVRLQHSLYIGLLSACMSPIKHSHWLTTPHSPEWGVAFLQQSLRCGCSSCLAALPMGWGCFAAALRRDCVFAAFGVGLLYSCLASSKEPNVFVSQAMHLSYQ